MTWFRVDDGFPDHPKLEGLERSPRAYMAAITVWTIMGADCASRLTDGFVSEVRLRKVLVFLGKSAQEGARALVDAELWHQVEGGYVFHDWREYQPTKSDVDASRRAKTERQRRWRRQSVDASTPPSTDASRDAAPVRASPIPAHPSPSQPRESEGESAQARAPGASVHVPSAGHVQMFRDTFAAAALELGWSPAPEFTHTQLRTATGRVLKYSTEAGKPFEAAAREMALSCLQDARTLFKAPGLTILDCEPGRPALARANGKGGRVVTTIGTTHTDFENVPSVEDQMAALKKRGLL